MINRSLKRERLDALKDAKVDKNSALIEYVAMMSDVELPLENEVSEHERICEESPEVL